MPHGETWFSFFGIDALSHWLSTTFGPSYLEHNPHLSAQHVVAFAAVILALCGVGFFVKRYASNAQAAIVPHDRLNPVSFIELMTSTVYNMMADIMGRKPAKFFLPLIGTCAFVIFFSNALGLIPGFMPPTDNLNTTWAMAIVIFFATHIFGIKEQGLKHYVAHFFGPPMPLPIKIVIGPLLFVIEMISHLVRPVTLAVRLTANMFADHLVLSIFVGLFAGIAVLAPSWFFVPVPVVMYLMGCIVVTVQTLVFCLLSTVYIAMAIEHSEEH
ncbi:MAG: F0F1 ATP synthase subunit A [Polyangiales bacterium]